LIANEKVVSYTARGIAARGGKKKTTTIINWRESITLLSPLAACSIPLWRPNKKKGKAIIKPLSLSRRRRRRY
jgi:hypothetical protein